MTEKRNAENEGEGSRRKVRILENMAKRHLVFEGTF